MIKVQGDFRPTPIFLESLKRSELQLDPFRHRSPAMNSGVRLQHIMDSLQNTRK